jgi:hypothetical protein
MRDKLGRVFIRVAFGFLTSMVNSSVPTQSGAQALWQTV